MAELPRHIRCVTLNTAKNDRIYAARLGLCIAQLRALNPDVVLLQESFRTRDGEVDTARTLALSLGLNFVYAPARTKPRRWLGHEVESQSGHAILVRGRIQDAEWLSLPSDEVGGERVALLACADLASGASLMAASIHLSHIRGDETRRREQLNTVLNHPWWKRPGLLRLLGGDANTTLEAPALSWLVDHPSLAVRSVRSADSLSTTFPNPRELGRAGRTIDHLFTVTAPDEPIPRVEASGIALDQPTDGVWPSDHAAVWADLVAPVEVTP